MTPGHTPHFRANAFQNQPRQAPSRSGGQHGSSPRDPYQSPAPRGDGGYSSLPVSDTAISQADGEA